MTGIKVRSGGVLVPVKKVKVRVSGALVTCKAVWVKRSGALVKIWTNLSVTPNPLDGYAASTAVSASATVTGHTGAVSWAYVSGNATISINSTTSTTPTFSATVSAGTTKSAVWRVTNAGSTADLTVNLTNTNPA